MPAEKSVAVFSFDVFVPPMNEGSIAFPSVAVVFSVRIGSMRSPERALRLVGADSYGCVSPWMRAGSAGVSVRKKVAAAAFWGVAFGFFWSSSFVSSFFGRVLFDQIVKFGLFGHWRRVGRAEGVTGRC